LEKPFSFTRTSDMELERKPFRLLIATRRSISAFQYMSANRHAAVHDLCLLPIRNNIRHRRVSVTEDQTGFGAEHVLVKLECLFAISPEADGGTQLGLQGRNIRKHEVIPRR